MKYFLYNAAVHYIIYIVSKRADYLKLLLLAIDGPYSLKRNSMKIFGAKLVLWNADLNIKF